MTRTDTNPFARPLYIMTKPAGPACNLACEYCYYLEKQRMYGDAHRGQMTVMSDDLLEKFIKEYIEAQTTTEVLFTWHGGEALLRPIAFYEKALSLQQRYAGSHEIINTLQTNGILLTDEWCRFFRQNGWLIGISIDGPRRFHDKYRRNCVGAGTWSRVMDGINLLNRHGVDWNAMAVVNDYNGDYPLDFYRFFKEIGCRYLQFTPIVERVADKSDDRAGQSVADFSVSPRQWGDFLIAVFDEWVRHDVGQMFVQLFDATLANWLGESPGVCTMARVCGHAGVIEHNGDVYSCDHFVFPQYKLGNIYTDTLMRMMYSERQQEFGRAKRDGLPGQCKECKYLFACNGECPKNRFSVTASGEPGLNYLCEGYRRFFEHAAPYMDFMRDEFRAARAPANVMNITF